jgi:tyrosine-protein phosphatase SIW14
MLRLIIISLIFFHSSAFAEPRVRPSDWAIPVIGSDLKNIYQVDKDIYRSEQPDSEDFEELAKFGIKEVLNLREYHSDNDETEKTSLKLHRLKIDTGSTSKEDIVKALKIIKNRKGPILIHCWHGSDRTGTIIATYRIIFNQWSKEKALDEMVNGGYGYHSSIYPQLVDLVKKLDIEKLRKQLQLPSVEKSR